MRLVGTAALVSGLALATAGATMAQDEPLTFGYLALGASNSFLVNSTKGFVDYMESKGAKVIVYDPQFSVEKQQNQVDELIAAGVDGAGLFPTDGVVAMGMVDKMKDAGILTVAGASLVGGKDEVLAAKGTYTYPNLLAEVNSNDYESGVMIGKFAAESVLPKDRKAKVAIVEGAPGFLANFERTNGFMDGLNAAGADYEIITNQPTDWTPEKAESVCQNILTANPDLDVIYIHADSLATGCAHAVAQSGSGVKLLSPAGGAQFGMDEITAGNLLASICTRPYTMGQLMAEALYAGVTSENPTMGEFITYPLVLVTKDTIADCPVEW